MPKRTPIDCMQWGASQWRVSMTDRTYESPELRVLGSVEELTQGGVKKIGGNDGFVLQINDVIIPISDAAP